VIMSRRRQNLVAAAEHELSHYLRRHVRITGLGEVAVGRAANESAFALRVEPALSFAVGNDRSERRPLSLISAIGARSALLLLLLSTAAATATTATLPAASTLVASAPSIVSMIAIAVLPLVALLLSLTLSSATTPAAAL